jgi:hypothetical protein
MTQQNNLETSGTLREHTPAELFVELTRANLNGSLRLENAGGQKTIVYFDAGEAVFAISNARRFRLFETLLTENKITKERLASIADYANDTALRENLIKENLLSKAETDALVAKQIEAILRDVLSWQVGAGSWTFSPLVRIKGDIRFKIDAAKLLLAHARSLSDKIVLARFKNVGESFSARRSMPVNVNLQPEEAFVFSRFDESALDVERATILSGLPAPAALRAVYTLWLAGFLERDGWRAPLSERTLAEIRQANFTLKKPAAPPPALATAAQILTADGKTSLDTKVNDSGARKEAEKTAPAQASLTLEEYLRRVEEAPDYYGVFDVATDALAADIKRSYFALAKRFHPDLFQREVDAEQLKRIQDAFTRVAHGYDTLKNEKTREVYDYKMRKELEQAKARASSGVSNGNIGDEERNRQIRHERAAEDFENGFSLFMDGNLEDAATMLARAVHLASDVARYRAYYGKALAADPSQKHKAEAEMQAAIRLEPDNADFRLMLAEFFVQMNLPRRAEGELNRVLSIAPDNRDAARMLADLKK